MALLVGARRMEQLEGGTKRNVELQEGRAEGQLEGPGGREGPGREVAARRWEGSSW